MEAELAATGVALAAARLEMVGVLARALAAATGPFPRPIKCAAKGRSKSPAEHGAGAGRGGLAENGAGAQLATATPPRAKPGTGAHRGDLAVTHREKSVPAALTSTGEQKAILVAIVLAAARLAMAERGRTPILLLDEIAAHLDDTRRQALYQEIAALGAQAWMTGTDKTLFDALGDAAQHFTIRDARIAAD